jgi:simple sugar transport system permease protein
VGSTYAWGYTLYYATNFIFTGLAVAVAFHARMFNIGGEGQAALGAWAWRWWRSTCPGRTGRWRSWPRRRRGALRGGWAALPAYLQAKRGSHVVITTIMFNYIAAALLNYLLVGPLKPTGTMETATAPFPDTTHIPVLPGHVLLRRDDPVPRHAANVTFFVALLCCLLSGSSCGARGSATRSGPSASRKGRPATPGIGATKIIMVSMPISGRWRASWRSTTRWEATSG